MLVTQINPGTFSKILISLSIVSQFLHFEEPDRGIVAKHRIAI